MNETGQKVPAYRPKKATLTQSSCGLMCWYEDSLPQSAGHFFCDRSDDATFLLSSSSSIFFAFKIPIKLPLYMFQPGALLHNILIIMLTCSLSHTYRHVLSYLNPSTYTYMSAYVCNVHAQTYTVPMKNNGSC